MVCIAAAVAKIVRGKVFAEYKCRVFIVADSCNGVNAAHISSMEKLRRKR